MIQFGAAKKIVRLIFMSNISRRSFLKGAGVAALAVAAAGVLAGCSDKETPDTGAKRDVKLKYLSTSAGKVFGDVVIQVPALATTVSFATIQANKPAAAEGYDLLSPFMPLLCTIHRLYGNFRRYCTESICQFLGQKLTYHHFLQSARMVVQCRPFLFTDKSAARTLLFFRRNGRRILFSYR